MEEYGGRDIVEVLRKHGIVVTPHRHRMLEHLRDMEGSVDDDECLEGDQDWYSASRIYSSFLEEGYFISLSSVYKNLSLFRNMGLINPDGLDV